MLLGCGGCSSVSGRARVAMSCGPVTRGFVVRTLEKRKHLLLLSEQMCQRLMVIGDGDVIVLFLFRIEVS